MMFPKHKALRLKGAGYTTTGLTACARLAVNLLPCLLMEDSTFSGAATCPTVNQGELAGRIL